MKEIIEKYYECEICNERYSNKEDALKCESKPVPNYFYIGQTVRFDRDRFGKISDILIRPGIGEDSHTAFIIIGKYHTSQETLLELNRNLLN